MKQQPNNTFITINRNELINPKDVLFLRGDVNYTTLFMADGSQNIVAYTLKKFEDTLPSQDFVRANKSMLLNTSFVKSHSPYEVVLENEEIVKISRRRKEDVLKKLSILK